MVLIPTEKEDYIRLNKNMNKEKQQKDNYVSMLDSKELGAVGGDVVIHTMPKRYMSIDRVTQSAKGTGFIILLIGFLFLLVAVFVMYNYVIKKNPEIEISQSDIQSMPEEEPVEKQPQPVADISPSPEEGQPEEEQSDDVFQIDNEETQEEDEVVSEPGSRLHNYMSPIDSDMDGLSDYEELIFGSSPYSKDSDGDGHFDLVEVMNLFNPAGSGKLVDNDNIEEYINEKYAYSFYTNVLWAVEPISGEDSLIINLGREQFILIVSQEMGDYDSFDSWYMDMLGLSEIDDNLRYENNEWQGIVNELDFIYYLKHPKKDYIITFNYQIGNDNTLYYKNIFNMMVKSLEVIEE
jgi:hypothetical protein